MGRSGAQLYVGVRKGAWGQEEDALLTKCIEKYGEGNWRQVPLRSGLNRCRKSCRLRWVNYLSPNIKRGEFAPDEIDLIIRLHRLLGNRWSLIAGRIPGRTANDIKNYWNSHLSKKLAGKVDEKKESFHEVIKPQPRTFNVNSRWLRKDIHANGEQQQRVKEPSLSPSEGEFDFWKNLFPEKEEENGSLALFDKVEEMGSGRDPFGFMGDEVEADDLFANMDQSSIF